MEVVRLFCHHTEGECCPNGENVLLCTLSEGCASGLVMGSEAVVEDLLYLVTGFLMLTTYDSFQMIVQTLKKNSAKGSVDKNIRCRARTRSQLPGLVHDQFSLLLSSD